MSRAQIGDYEMLKFAPPSEKSIRRLFSFPKDADDGVYGIDVSHHNGPINWTTIKANKIAFVYIKASQGAKYRDRTFPTNWRGAGTTAGLPRGAYHFLSAGVSGKDQAKNFIDYLGSVGKLDDVDLTPVLDIEWDIGTVNGVKGVDRWTTVSRDAIVTNALAWLNAVEQATGRKPVIYTAASWWTPIMGTDKRLAGYAHWLADYRPSSMTAGSPKRVPGHQYLAWQFTDVGQVPTALAKVDVNRLKSTDLARMRGKPMP